MKTADVDAPLSQNRSDATDDTRHIAVPRYQHVAAGYSLDVDPVDLSDPSFARLLTKTKQRSRHSLLTGVCHHTCLNSWYEIGGSSNIGGGHIDSPLFCDQERIDDVHTRAYIAQQPGQKRSSNRR